MCIAIGWPVGPITAINDSNDAPRWNCIPYMVWIIKIYLYPFSSQKFKNLHYGLWRLQTAVTRAPLKIDARR